MSFVNPTDTLISLILLYSSFFLISISFYAQLIHNWKRKKISGLDINYILLGLFSYFNYALFISCYYFLYFYIHFIRLDSRIIDVLFGIHSFICFLLFSIQAYFEYDKLYKSISMIIKIIIPILLISSLLIYVLPIIIQKYHFNLAAYSLVISFYLLYCLKYYFQIKHNHSRKSTIGFNFFYSLFDLGGNIFGVAYYTYNMSLQYGWIWIDIIGWVCFFCSIIGNICLMVQHWVLYANSNSDLGNSFFENFLINKLD